MKRIAYADNTGYVYIVTPAYNDLLRNQDIGDDDFLNYVIEKDIPKTARILIIDDEGAPTNVGAFFFVMIRTF